MRGETNSFRLETIDQRAAQKQRAGRAGTDRRLQGRDGDGRGYSDRVDGITHLRVRGNEDKITRTQQRAAPGDRRPLHRDHHHRPQASNSAIDAAEVIDVPAHQFRLLNGRAKVESSAENAPRSPQKDHANRFVSFERCERLFQRIKHGDPQRVASFGIVEGKHREVVIALEGDKVFGHRCMVAGWTGCIRVIVTTSAKVAARTCRTATCRLFSPPPPLVRSFLPHFFPYIVCRLTPLGCEDAVREEEIPIL